MCVHVFLNNIVRVPYFSFNTLRAILVCFFVGPSATLLYLSCVFLRVLGSRLFFTLGVASAQRGVERDDENLLILLLLCQIPSMCYK